MYYVVHGEYSELSVDECETLEQVSEMYERWQRGVGDEKKATFRVVEGRELKLKEKRMVTRYVFG